MNARPSTPSAGPPEASTRGVAKPWSATSAWKTVSLAAVAASGMTRATSGPAHPVGGSARRKDTSSAQNPPVSGTGSPS